MVLGYIIDAKDWTANQARTTVGNIGDSVVQSKDKILYDDDLDNISRRQFIESTGAAFLGYETSKDAVKIAGATVDDIDVQWKVGPFGEIPEDESNQTPTSESTETSTTNSETATDTAGVDAPQNYEEFSEDLGRFGQGDIRYLHGALSADPRYVEDVDTTPSEGILFDSVLLEYDEMSQGMTEYLETTDETGNLETWLEEYERRLH